MRIYICLAVLLAACGTPEQEYSDGLVLHDKLGCAFTVRQGAGDTVFLRYNRQESDPACEFVGRGREKAK